MGKRTPTPLGAIIGGAVAGAVGTVAMDLLWYRRYREDGGEDDFMTWEFGSGAEDYESAPAPAKVGKRLVEGLFQKDLPDETVGTMTKAVHWGTGIMWGVLSGILAGSGRGSFRYGPLVGVAAWLTSYGVLAPADLYKPIWEYDPETLWGDLSAHLVYGLGAGATLTALGVSRPDVAREESSV